MKISARGIYAVEIMMDILEYGEKTPVAMKDVALRRDISNKYAEQVVSTLSFAGLVKSIRGPKGGYQATESAKKATVGTILRMTESILKERNNEQESIWLTNVLKELDTAIDDVLDSHTLTEILESRYEAGNDYVI